MNAITARKGNFLALLPLLIFVSIFLGVGIYLDDFYAFPSPIAVVLGILSAFLLFRDSMNEKVNTLLKGCGDSKIITMCLIYLLAGAFTAVCKATGSVDAIVDLGMKYISADLLYAGVFVLSAFLSFSTGTSVGAIVALAAVVMSIGDRSGASLAVLSASLLGGAMFGDNLSFISDTTIAATQTQEISIKDKFRQNALIAIPAALLTIGVLLFQGYLLDGKQLAYQGAVQWLEILPYLLVIGLAILGFDVFLVLTVGILSAGLIGVWKGHFGLLDIASLSYEGFLGMMDIFLLSLLTGGLAALVTRAGGLAYITRLITRKISGRAGYLGLGALVGMTNMAIANNTVSILVTGNIAREIGRTLKLDRVKIAAVLDIIACVVQGVLPYGAQVLLLLSYADGRFGYLELVSNAWYLWILLGGSLYVFTISRKSSTPQEQRIPAESLREAV